MISGEGFNAGKGGSEEKRVTRARWMDSIAMHFWKN